MKASLCGLIFLTCSLFSCGEGFEVHQFNSKNDNMPFSGQAHLSWQAPLEDEDGNPLNDLAGFTLYYADAPLSVAADIIRVNVGMETQYNLSGLSPGTYYFAVSAYDLSGNEGKQSPAVPKEVR
ncbi:MAG: fibronectin type III domain-containing protein [Bdellovibrionaceae bacterium]|nr:fibronectin type III domain-containing protein [Bdellovibrionales bacterium]MCB9083438.1 fibronectin type III domain-containing protein [Pseudobdellovibrionaceae bacterium]